MVQTSVQIKADIPVGLKRRTFAALALQGVPFNKWLQGQMEQWLQSVAQTSAEQLGRGACADEVLEVSQGE